MRTFLDLNTPSLVDPKEKKADPKDAKTVLVNFHLQGDNFPHAWHFNRFRVDSLGDSKLVTLALATEASMLSVNAFVVPDTDLRNNRDRTVSFLGATGRSAGDLTKYKLGFSTPPARVYPINHISLSRVDMTAEMGLFRHSVNSLVTQMNEAKKSGGPKAPVVTAYPVVMFRADLDVLLGLIQELYTT